MGSGINSKVNKTKNEAKKEFDHNLIIEGAEITSLSQKWQDIANQERDLIASGFLLYLEDKRFAKLKPDSTLSAASSIKIPILLVTLKLVDSGQLRWDEALQLSQDVIGSEAGWMAYQKLGTLFPVYEVATEMIRISDNTATNLLIQRIGGIDALNRRFKSFGLKNTSVKNWLPLYSSDIFLDK